MSDSQLQMNFEDKQSQPGSFALHLKRPLAIFDLETTGVNIASDRIVEIAIVRIQQDGTRQVKRKLINPEMPIPEAASSVHGITNDMVKDAPTFRQAANEIRQFIDGCDLGGYNSNRFDIPLLVEEFLRVDQPIDLNKVQFLDVQKIFHSMEQRTLSAAYKFYCNKELDGAHSAEVDASATFEVLLSQVQRYPQLGNSIESIIKVIGEEEVVDFARRFVMENGKEIFNFGKYKGQVVEDVLRRERQYYDWMMKGDFPLHTKQKLTEILNRTLLKR